MKKRIQRIFSNTEKLVDAILIKNSTEPFIDQNFFYVTGLQKGLFEGSSAIIFPDGKIDLIVSELEEESARKADANIKVYKKTDDYYNLVRESLKNTKKIGLNFDFLTYRDSCRIKENIPSSEFIDISSAFSKTRSIKDEIEIKLMKGAARVSDIVMEKIPDLIYDGLFEYELAAEINYLMQKNGADHPAFDTISSFGKNTAEPHYSHGNAMVKNGDFIICDFGACYCKYNSDITRTFVLKTVSEKQKKMYDTVFKAQKIGLNKICEGIKASDVHKAVAEFINNTEFKGCFIHSTGHSLGLSVHDLGPGLREETDAMLTENMVLTVEPGVYIPGFGGVRIEDDIVVKKNGFDFLTNSSRNLVVVG